MKRAPNKRVAVIGAGPMGLATAKELLEEGHDVVCYDASSKLGGEYLQFKLYCNLHILTFLFYLPSLSSPSPFPIPLAHHSAYPLYA